jgi:hypothetical protein
VAARNFEICIDANDPAVLRPFWRTALGYTNRLLKVQLISSIRPASFRRSGSRRPRRSKRARTVHLDIRVREQERKPLVEALLALGGTVVATYSRFTRWRTRRATSSALPPNEQRPRHGQGHEC